MGELKTAIYGKRKSKSGISPAVALVQPKYPHNVAAAVRAASCFDVPQVWFTGNRVSLTSEKGNRLPREERMRGYQDVDIRHFEHFFDEFDEDVVPVAVELMPNSEILTNFVHPEKALYVFGPEDGGLKGVHFRHCHRFVAIPTLHCVNLAAAVYLILYDRFLKEQQSKEPADRVWNMNQVLKEDRWWSEDQVIESLEGLVE